MPHSKCYCLIETQKPFLDPGHRLVETKHRSWSSNILPIQRRSKDSSPNGSACCRSLSDLAWSFGRTNLALRCLGSLVGFSGRKSSSMLSSPRRAQNFLSPGLAQNHPSDTWTFCIRQSSHAPNLLSACEAAETGKLAALGW